MPRRRVGPVDQQSLQPHDAEMNATAANPHRPPAKIVIARRRLCSLGKEAGLPRQEARDVDVARRRAARDPDVFGFAVWQLKDGEDRMIADRLVEIFNGAKKA